MHAQAINGAAQENYYRWLALTYVTTLTSHPAVSLPCGLDHAGMPFGLQVVGRFRGDREVLGAAHAMEQSFAAQAQLRRPRPDLHKLQAAVPALKSIVTAPPLEPGAQGGQGGTAASAV
jgi:hypothetical protein